MQIPRNVRFVSGADYRDRQNCAVSRNYQMPSRHLEPHYTKHTNWLRAAVLGANDGIVSTASLVLGVAAADATHNNIVIAGVAGLVAGAMSMAAGEYVSVSTPKRISSRQTSSGNAGNSSRMMLANIRS